MKKLVVSQFVTLDGVMDSPEKWNRDFLNDEDVSNDIIDDLAASDMLLFGKTTYEFFATRWPSRTGKMAGYMNALPKYVVSSSLQNATWNNSAIIDWDKLAELKNEKNILVLGSHQLVQLLMKDNLIDEYRIYIYPLTLGSGKRLFEGAQKLKLISARVYKSQTISTVYQPEK